MRKISYLQKRFTKTALASGIIAATLFACNNQVLDPFQSSTGEDNSVAESMQNEQALDLVAQALAKSLVNSQVRSLIKNQAALKFDGEHDILYAKIASMSVNGKTLAQTMNSAQRTNPLARQVSMESFTKQIPLLNISVPVHFEDWNVETIEPMVVISPSSFVKDEVQLKTVKAYDSSGKIHYLDAKKAPQFPVIVVGINERIEINKDGQYMFKKGLYFTNNTKGLRSGEIFTQEPDVETNLQDPGDGVGGGGGGGNPPPGGGGTNCSFSSGQYEYLDYIYCENGDAWEGWFDGGPEFYLTIGGYDVNSSNPSIRAKVLDGGNRVPFYGANYHDFEATPEGKSFGHTALIRWFADYGEIITYLWREEDTGGIVDGTEDVTVKWAGQTYSTNLITQLRSNDDFVTKQPVYRQDCSPFYYGSLTFRWKIVRN